MKKYYLAFSFLAVFFAIAVFAQDGIQYPVAELGNCQDEASCKSYCDEEENLDACLDFAEKNNLMSAEEIKVAKDFSSGKEGPGGCTTKDECMGYCNDISHIDECVAFAEENNLMPPQELAEAKKVQRAIANGVTPPPCGNKEACDSYCEDSSHMEECITFAEQAGLLEGRELSDAKKMLAAVKRGVQPPPCAGKDSCDEYCSMPENMEVCMNFAIEAGFMNEQEKEEAQKMLQAVRKGAVPPKCRSKEECDTYCGKDEHLEECMNFAIAAGFMSEKDAEMARKTGGKGPGNCRGKEECESFCNDPANQETCFNFAKEHGLMSEEDLQQMEEGKQQMQQALSQAPPEVLECLQSALGAEKFEGIKNGTAMPSREIGDQIQTCFQNMMPPRQDGQGQMQGEGPRSGPGGCQSPEECQAYCQSNPQECQNFGGPQGQPPVDGQSFQQAPQEGFGPQGQSCAVDEKSCQFGPYPGPGTMPPEGIEFRQGSGEPCEGPDCQFFAPRQEGFEGEFQQQFQKEFERQYQEQYQRQIEQQFQQQIPEGTMPFEGQPVSGSIEQQTQQFQQFIPQSGEIAPPPAEMIPPSDTVPPPEPTSLLDQVQNFLAGLMAP